MLISEHPFHMLGISSRSGKREIFQRVEELAIHSASESLRACRTQLIHPAKRLDAEISWFPGLAPSKVRQIVVMITTDSNLPQNLEEKLPGIDPLARFNTLAYWLASHRDVTPGTCGLVLHHLSTAAQAIRPIEVAETLNADRAAAGFSAATEISGVEKAIANRTDSAAIFLADRLMQYSWHTPVVTVIVERETSHGQAQASEFIGRFVDRYQIHVQPILDRQAQALAEQCEHLTSKAGIGSVASFDPLIAKLERHLSDWDSVAQPIQLMMKSRGLRDTHSIEVAKRVRRVAIRLANEYNLHEHARRLTSHLREVFDEVPEIAELADADSNTLDEIVTDKERERQREEEYRKEIELDMMIGKDRLQIDQQFITYKGRRLAFEEVEWMRWGIFKSYTNGIRTSREFTIWLGPSERGRAVAIECVRFMEAEAKVLERYATILDKLWKAAGYRLLIDITSKIMADEPVPFGGAVVTKTGIWLPKPKWFKSEHYFAQWEELTKSTQGGVLWIGSTRESKASVSLDLRADDNAVILDRLLDILWKDGNYQKLRSGTLFRRDPDRGE